MNDALKVILIAAATSAVVQLLLAPFVHQFYGYPTKGSEVPVAAAIGEAVPAARPAVGAAPVAAPALTAPNIQGMAVDEAREAFRAQGIVIIEDGAREDDTAKVGTILQQRPLPGAPMAAKEIRVIVSKAPQGIEVPNVVGTESAVARKKLEEAGFAVAVDRAPAGEAAPGSVIEQQPPAGAHVAKGGKVRIVAAQAATVEVPKVTRKKLPKARTVLEEAGLVVGKVRQVEDPELSGGTVLRQSPKAGAEANPGDRVDLVVVAPD